VKYTSDYQEITHVLSYHIKFLAGFSLISYLIEFHCFGNAGAEFCQSNIHRFTLKKGVFTEDRKLIFIENNKLLTERYDSRSTKEVVVSYVSIWI